MKRLHCEYYNSLLVTSYLQVFIESLKASGVGDRRTVGDQQDAGPVLLHRRRIGEFFPNLGQNA